MLGNISWTLFFTVLTVAIIIYYSIVGAVFYPKEILTLLLGRKNRIDPKETTPAEKKPVQFTPNFAFSPGIADNDSVPLLELREHIRTLFRISKDTGEQKARLEEHLRSLFSQYPSVTGDDREAINSFIDGDMKMYGFDLTSAEAAGLWPQA